jgi:hypothetical protein
MKRFYKQAGHANTETGWQVTLDGRKVKTQGGRQQIVPSAALAAASIPSCGSSALAMMTTSAPSAAGLLAKSIGRSAVLATVDASVPGATPLCWATAGAAATARAKAIAEIE